MFVPHVPAHCRDTPVVAGAPTVSHCVIAQRYRDSREGLLGKKQIGRVRGNGDIAVSIAVFLLWPAPGVNDHS
jgi:hypothetical protein